MLHQLLIKSMNLRLSTWIKIDPLKFKGHFWPNGREIFDLIMAQGHDDFPRQLHCPEKTMFTLGLDPGFGWGSCPRCPARWPWIFKRVPVVVAPSFWPLWWRTGGPMIFSSPRRWIFKRHPSALELNLCTNHCIFYALTTAY